MADRYQNWTAGRTGGYVAKRLGLPAPEPLRRHRPGTVDWPDLVVLGGAANQDEADGKPRGRMFEPLRHLLESLPTEVRTDADPAETYAAPGALIFDATGITDTARLAELYDFFHPRIRSLAPCGRVLIFSTPPEHATTPAEAVAQRAVEGFMRSLGKELRRGGTANQVQVEPGAEESIKAAVRFFLSPRSAYVSGQVLRIGSNLVSPAADAEAPNSWDRPLADKTAVVTGAARGIGAEIARTLARDGAFVLCVDVPAQITALQSVADEIGGKAFELDISSPTAAEDLANRLKQLTPIGADIVVHNAGILRDKTLGRMERDQWDAVLAVNLIAVETLTRRLLDPSDPLLRPGGRIVCTSSISAIAGNVGQANYAASKAGLIGLVQALAPSVAEQFSGTINAVAPGFIETQMTASVPLFIREAGRRMNSLKQGGQPIDVAETVAFLAGPGSHGVNGQVLRVCGQALLGA